jgi:hypothetical protein
MNEEIEEVVPDPEKNDAPRFSWANRIEDVSLF